MRKTTRLQLECLETREVLNAATPTLVSHDSSLPAPAHVSTHDHDHTPSTDLSTPQ
jgi:hypothetical protein